MIPNVLFSNEQASVDELIRARFEEHSLQEKLQTVSQAPGLGPDHPELQAHYLKAMLCRARKEVSILSEAVEGLEHPDAVAASS